MVYDDTRDPTAWAVGLCGTATIALTFFVVASSVPRAVPAILLAIPITVASARGGWRIGVPIGVLAAAAYCLAFVPPIGAIRIGMREDLYIFATFVAIAGGVGAFARRQRLSGHPSRALSIDHEAATLLLTVLHDLRIPLNRIQQLSLELIHGDGEGDDVGRRRLLINSTAGEASRVDRVVAKLTMGRRRSTPAMLRLKTTSVAGLLHSAIAGAAERVDVLIDPRIDDDVSQVIADPAQIDLVFATLLRNSLRFAPWGSTVVITAVSEDRFVRFNVTDEGPELSPPALLALSVDSTWADDSSTAELGLTVCRAIVEAHGGKIHARTAGTGASITFTLPTPADVP